MADEPDLDVDDCSAISCRLTLRLGERPTFLARLTLMLTLVHAEFLFLVWIPGARICPFQGVKLKAILPLENPFISSETHAHTTDTHRPRAVGAGSARGSPDAIKGGFCKSLRASHRWVAVAGCQAAWPTHRARRPSVSARRLAGSSLRALATS